MFLIRVSRAYCQPKTNASLVSSCRPCRPRIIFDGLRRAPCRLARLAGTEGRRCRRRPATAPRVVTDEEHPVVGEIAGLGNEFAGGPRESGFYHVGGGGSGEE